MIKDSNTPFMINKTTEINYLIKCKHSKIFVTNILRIKK